MAKTILIWDDNKDILYTMEQICKFQKWRPLLAENSVQAQKFLRTSAIDLVIVDYHMPDMDGITAVKTIRKILPHLPIIVLTIEEREFVAERFMEAGADDYALKPIKAVDLIARIKVHLSYAEKSQYYDNTEKGIGSVTLKKLEDAMRELKEYKEIEELEEITGIKKKTLYRYLQYMQKEGQVDVQNSYGRMGRPKLVYFLKR